MNILITGIAGFIGSNIAEHLLDQGYRVYGVDNLSTGKIEHVPEKAIFEEVDIRDKQLVTLLEAWKVDVVMHTAGQITVSKSLEDPMHDASINIEGTINLLESMRHAGVPRIIYSSSAAVYGPPRYLPIDETHAVQPISPYGISKWVPETYFQVYARLYGLQWVALRYANVYGKHQDPKGEGGVVSIFMDKFMKGQAPTIYGDGHATRDYIHVADVVQANICALTRGDGQVFNIGTGVQTSVKTLFDSMKDNYKSSADPNYAAARPGDIKHSYFQIEKAQDQLDFQPKVSLRDGLKRTIAYYNACE